MSHDTFVGISIRAKDVEQFVAAFKAKYPDLCLGEREIKTEGDVLACFLEDPLDGPEFEEGEGVWHASFAGVCGSGWVFDGVKEFFQFCIPYVNPETAWFCQTIEGESGVYWGTNYKVANGRLVESERNMLVDSLSEELEPPKVSEVIAFLKRRRPTAWKNGNHDFLYIGVYGYGWEEIEEEIEDDTAEKIGDVRREIDEFRKDDVRKCASFELNFKRAREGKVDSVCFSGPVFDWDSYVVYDQGLTPADLAAVIREYVTFDPRHILTDADRATY